MPKSIQGDLCAVPDCGRQRAIKSNGTRRAMCPGHVSRKRQGTLARSAPIKDYVHVDGGGYLSSYGYWLRSDPTHPLAFANGDVLVHRAVLYADVGPGKHPCHWCGSTVDWGIAFPAEGALVVDHLDADRLNNALPNLVPACQPCNARRAKAGNPLDWSAQN